MGENTLTPSEAETTLHNWKILIVKDSVKIQRLAEVNEKKSLATFEAFFKNKVESCNIYNTSVKHLKFCFVLLLFDS